MEKYVVIATFTLPMEAQLACGRLEAEGIQAHVLGEGAATTFGAWSAIGGRVELYVSPADAERALTVLAECMPEEKWRTELAEHLQPTRLDSTEWTSSEGIQQSAEREKESLWLCSVCGEAVSVEETECPACGTSREALRPASSQDLRENRPAERTPHQPLPTPPALSRESGDQMAELEDIPRGDMIASRALKAAAIALLFSPIIDYFAGFLWSIPLVVAAFAFVGQLLMYKGELSPKGMRNLYIAVALDLLVLLLLLMLLRPFILRFLS
jgi:hypothetical protein